MGFFFDLALSPTSEDVILGELEKLDRVSRTGIYFVSACVALLPAMVFGLTSIFRWGETFEISIYDGIWSSMCVMSGALLLSRYKLSWISALTCLALVAEVNLLQVWANWSVLDDSQYVLQFVFSLSVICSTLLVASYYRFPYVDRRDTIFFGIADRHRVHMKAVVNDKIFGEVVSASMSGVLFRTEAELRKDDGKNLCLTIQDLKLEGVPVTFVGMKDRDFRFKFKSLGIRRAFGIKKKLRDFPKES